MDQFYFQINVLSCALIFKMIDYLHFLYKSINTLGQSDLFLAKVGCFLAI